MLANRSNLQWPRAAATVGSACRAQARCLGTTTTTMTTSTTTTTTAPPEGGGRDRHENRGQGKKTPLIRHTASASRTHFAPLAYKPVRMSYADLLARATVHPRWAIRRAVAPTRNKLGTDQYAAAVAAAAGDGATPEAGAAGRAPRRHPPRPPREEPLDYLLDVSLARLTLVSKELRPVLDAVAEDVAQGRVRWGETYDLAELRTLALGRRALWVQYETRNIMGYLNNVADNTERVRWQLAASMPKVAREARPARPLAALSLAQKNREAIAYDLAGELRAARLAGEWRRVWTLESRLSSMSRFLSYQPLAKAYNLMIDSQNDKITEISMARMAEWDDSYESLYAEDARARGDMNLASRYQTIFKGAKRLRPWNWESRLFTLKSPASDDVEFVVLRIDQRGGPAPLWPQGWSPIPPSVRHLAAGATVYPAKPTREMEGQAINTPPGTTLSADNVPETNGQEPTGEIEGKAINTPPGTTQSAHNVPETNEGQAIDTPPDTTLSAHDVPETNGQEQQGSPDTPAKADTPQASHT